MSVFLHQTGRFDPFFLLLSRLEERGLYKRAVAISVFHFNLARAIQSLDRGAITNNDLKYKFVAMALAGYSEKPEHVKVWKQTCESIVHQLDDPYFLSCFSFLCDTEDSFRFILNHPEIRLVDRIAFACRFLPDAEVSYYTFLQSNHQISKSIHLSIHPHQIK